MRTSKKVFAVLTVALPVLLLASMVKAQDADPANSSMCYSMDQLMSKVEACRKQGGDPQKEGRVTANGQECYTGIKCVMKNASTPAQPPSTPPTTGVVTCKRAERGMLMCDDGMRYKMIEGDMPQTTPPTTMPAPTGKRCEELEMKLKMLRSQAEKPSKEVADRILEVEKMLKECRSGQQTSTPTATPAPTTTNDRCKDIERALDEIRTKMKANPNNSSAYEEMYKNTAEKLKSCQGSTVNQPVMDKDMVVPATDVGVSATVNSTVSSKPTARPMTTNMRTSCKPMATKVDGKACTIMICRGGRTMPNSLDCGQ